MAIKESVYKFQIDNSDYIGLLTHYLGHLRIESLEPNFGVSLNEATIDDLPQIIEQIKAKAPKDQKLGELSLITRYRAEDSLKRVLPEFERQDYAVDRKLKKTVADIQDYISWHAAHPEDEDEDEDQDPDFPELTPLTQEEAWKVINLVHKKAPFLSVIDLPSKNCIMILDKDHLFKLSYGPAKTSIYTTSDISFDLDEGFTDAYSPCATDSPCATERSQSVPGPKELAKAFNEWVQNNRSGYIFPPSQKKIKILSDKIRQHISLAPPGLAEIIAEYAYGPKVFQTKSSLPLRSLLIPLVLLTGATAGIIAGAAFIGFSLALIAGITTLGAVLLGTKLIKNFVNKRAEEKAFHLASALNPSEKCAFDAGVAAGKSYRGYFTSWGVRASYRNYVSYTAGKQMAQKKNTHARYESR